MWLFGSMCIEFTVCFMYLVCYIWITIRISKSYFTCNYMASWTGFLGYIIDWKREIRQYSKMVKLAQDKNVR